jgi:rhamnose transport system ATP-binding protein
MVPAVKCSGLSKSFGMTRALKNVDLTVMAGSIHALVGENGAGKSTCLGLISGRLEASSGTIMIHGKTFHGGSPRASRAAGVAAVYQELTIVPARSAQENVFLGAVRSRAGLASDRAMRRQYVALCARLDIPSHPDVPAGHLSLAEQQMLEIMRAIVADARIVLYDEPTTSLSAHERQVLFRVMREQRSRGVTQIFVSHNLDDVLDMSDHVTVFRNGSVAAEVPRANCDKNLLVSAMLGRELDAELQRGKATEPDRSRSRPLLRVERLTLARVLDEISFDVYAGEIVGIAGLVGSGRSSVLRSIAGVEKQARGRMEIDQTAISWPRTPREGHNAGIVLVPEDRKLSGLVMQLSGVENVLLSSMRANSRAGWILPRKSSRVAVGVAQQFGLDPGRLALPASTLSGGNQQKLLLARAALSKPKVLLADEPTRGIDVGAKAEILAQLRRLAVGGTAVVVVSSELEEILAISDRVLVLSEGRQVAFLDNRDRAFSVADLLTMAFGLPSSTGLDMYRPLRQTSADHSQEANR